MPKPFFIDGAASEEYALSYLDFMIEIPNNSAVIIIPLGLFELISTLRLLRDTLDIPICFKLCKPGPTCVIRLRDLLV